MGVVRRLKTEEMARFKFATNFGLHKDTLEYLHDNVFKKHVNEIQKKLQKVSNE
jgi:hypothetical protein